MSIQVRRIRHGHQVTQRLIVVLVVAFGEFGLILQSTSAAGWGESSSLNATASANLLQATAEIASTMDVGLVPLPTASQAEANSKSAVGAVQDLSATSLDAAQVETNTWPMAGANPQRTSWTPEQVPSADYLAEKRQQGGWAPGQLHAWWYKPIEPYISHKVQVIAANDTLYISTAKGLYALDAASGAEKWVYATELPLGNSPTISMTTAGTVVAYVGGLDHKIHAINALTGAGLWTYEATQGFETNPLLVNGKLYAGNRDGYFYAINVEGANTAQLAWKYLTGGAILLSAAYTVTTANPGGVVYFASNDSYAYALDAQTGALVWRTKLPGAGFHSWWPVIYGGYVIFPGSSNYRDNVGPGASCNCNIDQLDREVFQNASTDPRGTPVGTRGADGWINASRITTYFQAKPWRRTYFVLNRSDGMEMSNPYAPVLWFGTQSGNRYPPIVGADGIVYQSNNYMSEAWINGGGVSGWRIVNGTAYISTPAAGWWAIDEPLAYSAGGNIIYWVYHDDLSAGGFDLSVPNTRFWDHGQPTIDSSREWNYWDYDSLGNLLPGYDEAMGGKWTYGGANGVYERNGDQNPLVPYKGKVYVIRGNAVLAFGVGSTPSPAKLSMARTVAVSPAPAVVDRALVRQKLIVEVQKILAAGHLRPGFLSSGHIDSALQRQCGDNLQDYWHDPSDTLYTLLRALPFLPADLRQSTRTYLQAEFGQYLDYTHIGWRTGAAREVFDLPPEVNTARANFGPSTSSSWDFVGWGGQYGGSGYPPHLFYTLWKYAQEFPGVGNANAKSIFNVNKSKLSNEPGDTALTQYPFVHNSFIAGYIGYLNLQKLAGDAEDAGIRTKLNRLLALRKDGFSKDTPYTSSIGNYCRALNTSRNFIFLVPELATYLHDNALSKVQQAVNEYTRIEPYWFVSAYEDTVGEAEIVPLYDMHALFQAKALILQEPTETLIKYLDVPAFQVGDLFYIQNLETILELENYSESIDKTASRVSARLNQVITYALTIGSPLSPTLPFSVLDTWSAPVGGVAPAGMCSASAGTPTCSNTQVTWSGNMPDNGQLVITYTLRVANSTPGHITNQMQVDGGAQGIYTRTVSVMVNPYEVYLPWTSR